MRISTTPLIILCTVFFLGTSYKALAQPVFSVTDPHHTCGPLPIAPAPVNKTGSFAVRITSVTNPARPTIRITVVGDDTEIFNFPMPSSFPAPPIVIPASAGYTGALTYFVFVNDGTVTSGPQPITIYNFEATTTSATDNTNPACSPGNGAIDVTVVGNTTAMPYHFQWAGPAGFVDPGTEDLSGLTGGDYTLTYSDSNTPATICTLGPIHINDPVQTTFTIDIDPTTPPPYCSTNTLKVDVSTSDNSYMYTVMEGASALTTPVAGNGGTLVITVPALSPGPHTLTVQAAKGACPPVFNSNSNINVTVGAVPVYTGATVSALCSNIATGINLLTFKDVASVAATSFNITAINPQAGLTGPTALPRSGGDNLISGDVWVNKTTGSLNVQYDIVPTTGGCPGAQFSITIPINPQPDYNSFSNLIPGVCSGVAIGVMDLDVFKKAGTLAATSYDLVGIDMPNLTAAGGSSYGAFPVAISKTDLADDAWQNIQSTTRNVVYHIVPKVGTCVGDEFTVTVTINPEPIALQPLTKTICSGDNVNFNLQTGAIDPGNGVASTFDWVATDNIDPKVTGETLTPQTTSLINDILVNTSSANQDVVYSVSPTGPGGCVGAQFTITVTISPEPVAPQPLSKTICSGDNVNFNLQTNAVDLGNGISSTFTWTATDNILPEVTGEAVGTQTTTIIGDVLVNTSPGIQTVDYTITPTSVGGCDGTPFTVTVTINPEPVALQPLSTVICSGDNVNFNLQTGGIDPGNGLASTFMWKAIADNGQVTGESFLAGVAGPIITDALVNTSSAIQTVDYTVTPTSTLGCVGDPFTVTVTINPRPSYHDYTDTAGICAVPLGVDLDGQKDAPSVLATAYDVEVLDHGAATPAGGSPALVKIFDAPTGEIADDVWSNATTGSIDVKYEITPKTGTCAGTAFIVIVKIKPQPVYSSGPASTCSGQPTLYDLNTTRSPSGVVATVFDVSIAPDVNLSPVSGVSAGNGDNMSISDDVWKNVTNASLFVVYHVIPTEAGCAGSSFDITVEVKPEPVYNTASLITICSEDMVGLDLEDQKVSTSISALTFDITAAPDLGLTPVGATALSVTGNSMTIADDQWRNVTTGPLTVTYTILARTADCAATATFTVPVTINPQPDYNSDSDLTGICSNPLGVDITALHNPTSVIATSFNITISAPGLTQIAGAGTPADLTDDVWQNLTGTFVDVTYSITPVAASGCDGSLFFVTRRILPTPDYNVYNNDNTPTGVCSRDVIGVASLDALAKPSSAVADTYTVTDITIPAGVTALTGIPATPFPYTVTSTDLADDAWKNTSNAAKDIIYKITPRAGTCDGPQFTVTVTINPEPVAPTDVPKAICSGDNVNFDLQLDAINLGNSLAGTSFSWIAVSDNSNVTGESFASAQTTVLINDVLGNATSVDQTVQYIVTPKGPGGCVGDDFTVTITVKPRPVLFTPQTTEVCSGSAVGYTILLTPSNLPAGTTFTWQAADNVNITGESTTVKTGAVITDILVNTGTGTETVTYTVTPFNGACAGVSQPVTVDVNKEAVAEAGNNQTICTDNGNYLMSLGGANVSGAASTGRWSFLSNPGNNGTITPEMVYLASPGTAVFAATVPGDYVLQLETNDPTGACVAATDVVTITVTEKPVITTPTLPKTICGNDAVAYSIAMTTVDFHSLTVFNWLTPTDPTGGAANAQPSPPGGVPMGTPGTIHINDILRNETGSNIDIFYDVTPSVGICFGATQRITITVKPSPVIAFNQNVTICSGDRVDREILLSPVNSPAGTKFSWPDPDDTGSATSRRDVPADPLGTIHIKDTLYNDQATPQIVTYKVIAQGVNGCYGAVRDINVTVNPGAVVEAGPAQAICSGGTATLNGASVTGLVTAGTWSIDPASPTGGTIDNSVSPPTFTAVAAGIYKLKLTSDDPGSCPAVSDVVVITVKTPGDPSCTGGGVITSPCDKVSVAPVWTAATCNNSDGSVHFDILDKDSGLPAVPATGSIRITIDGPSSGVNFNDPDFADLPVGIYTYEVQFGDATCVKTGDFTIDRSGTVGTPVAIVVEDPACFGDTGTATLNAVDGSGNAVATGVSLEWSVDGNTWSPFIGGADVSGLPAGSNLIFVRRPGDPCAGEVNLTFADPTDIPVTLTPTDATCNNNDGSIAIGNLTGGTGPYIFTLQGTQINLPADVTFKGLSAGVYNITVTDSKSCTKVYNPVTIAFPGVINHSALTITNPDCTGQGANGIVEFTVLESGKFEFAVSNDPLVQPSTFEPANDLTNVVRATGLSHGDYIIWVRPAGAGTKCVTKVEASVAGAYAVSYDATATDVVCFSQPTAIIVENIKGAPELPYNYTLTNTVDNSVLTGIITKDQAKAAYSITGVDNGRYALLITQDQSSLVGSCAQLINGGSKSFTISGPSGALDSLYVKRGISVPDLPSGSALVGVQPSGLEPYEVRLELTDPLFASQNFVSDWAEVPLNPQNLKFEQSYTNLFAGVYTLGIRDAGGCERTYVFNLDVDTDLFIPNIFTPNGDEHNEVFYIRNLPADAKLLITNRWGNEVYKSSAYQNDWGGGDAADGMYYYTLTLGSKSFTGWVEILRAQ